MSNIGFYPLEELSDKIILILSERKLIRN